MAKNQFYGIKFPFKSEDSESYFIDLNASLKEKVRSLIMHVIFTPKGQKLRDLEFGTNLIKYIFEPNDNLTWGEVENEVREAINNYVPNATLNNIEVMEQQDDNRKIFVRVDYTVTNGIQQTKDSIVTAI